MTSESSTGSWCEWPHCENEAWYRLTAAWTIFDFDEWLVCHDHFKMAYTYASRRLVDGNFPVEIIDETLPLFKSDR